jgi:hypothetical protein
MQWMCGVARTVYIRSIFLTLWADIQGTAAACDGVW